MSKREPEKCLTTIFMIIIALVAIGFVVSIGVLIHERYRFSQWIISATTYKRSMILLDNMARLLEAYNKSSTTEIISLLYTVLATLAFSYGLVVFTNIQKEARNSKKILEEIRNEEHTFRNQTFFSLFENRLNLVLYCAINLKVFLYENEAGTWLTRLYEQIKACIDHFPVWEIKRRSEIDPFSKHGLIDALTMIKQNLRHFSQEKFEVSTITPDGDKSKTVIQLSLDICEDYLNAIDKLTENMKLSD